MVLAQAVNGILAQRLMPRLCSECAVAAVHPPLESVPTYAPVGCAQCKGLLGLADHRSCARMSRCDALEEVRKRGDPAPVERRSPDEELALGPFDVRPVGHDEDRVAPERGQISVE